MSPAASRLFCCYVPGLDRRRITEDTTPFVARLLESVPTVELETIPVPDLLPTILTGVLPHEHGITQVALRPEARIPGGPRAGLPLPGAVSTTLQCLRHAIDRGFSLPAVPPRRRRQFEMRPPAERGRGRGTRALENVAGFPTVLGIIPDSRFLFVRRLDPLRRLARALPSAHFTLEFLELRALDLFQRWHMHARRGLRRAYRQTDALLQGLSDRCEERGVTFILLVDHGGEPVTGAIHLQKELSPASVPPSDFSFFIDLTMARFWFHTEEARARLSDLLRQIPNTRLLSLRDLRDVSLLYNDDAHGEWFLAAEPGWVFYPNDHHHRVHNLIRGLSDRDQRPRLFGARPRGAHGYLPGHASEHGFMALADARFRARRPAAALVDVAPTFIALTGDSPPTHMRGQPVFG